MKVLRVSYRLKNGKHNGYRWYSSKEKANRTIQESLAEQCHDGVREFDIKMNKQHIIGFLNRMCSYPDK